MSKKKIYLYSETFKGYVRIEQKKQGNELIGLTIKFTNDKEEATTFIDEHSKNDFIKQYAIGVNYKFRTEII